MRLHYSGREQPPSPPDSRVSKAVESVDHGLPVPYRDDGTRTASENVNLITGCCLPLPAA